MACACPSFVQQSIRNAQAFKQFTLAIVHKDGRLLLGLKKRGVGCGFYNGFGGKVEPNESLVEAAHRELEEEAGISAMSMEACGRLHFVFDDVEVPWEVHVFRVHDYTGEPSESEEMRPQWFGADELPFEQMWADDRFWYPLFIAAKSDFVGLFGFTKTTTMVWHKLVEVSRQQLQEMQAVELLQMGDEQQQQQPGCPAAG